MKKISSALLIPIAMLAAIGIGDVFAAGDQGKAAIITAKGNQVIGIIAYLIPCVKMLRT